jgi:hypothetical protein
VALVSPLRSTGARMRRSAAILLIAAAVAGCGYQRTATISALPPELRTIAVPTFRNRTFEPLVEAAVGGAIKQRLLTQRRLELSDDPDNADLVLRGTITAYATAPLSYDASRSVALEYRVTIRAEIALLQRGKPTPLWSETGWEATADYFVTADTAGTRVARDTALAEASRRLAEDIVARVLEGT